MKVDKRKWEWKKLGNIMDVRDGTHDSPKYYESGIPLVTTKNIINGSIDFSDVKYISIIDANKINERSYVDNDDIIMPMIGTIGGAILVKKECDFCIKNVALIKKKQNNLICNRFLLNLLNSSFINSYFTNNSKGVSQKFVSLKILRNLSIPVPPLSEQQAIASELDAIQDLISKHKEQLKDYDNLAKSIFNEMFGDVVSNEKGWEIVKFGDLANDIKYGTSRPATDNGKYKYLRMNNITDNGYITFDDLKYIDIPDDEYEKCVARKYDILFNRTNSREKVGKTALYMENEEMIIAGYLIRVRINDKASPLYLVRYLNMPKMKDYLRRLCRGSVGQANINSKEMQNIPIPLPPLSLQQTFAHRIEAIEKQKELVKQQITDLQTLFDSQMQYYFD